MSWVMIHVSWGQASVDQQIAVEQSALKLHFRKLPLTRTWMAQFPEHIKPDDAVNSALKDFSSILKKAEVHGFEVLGAHVDKHPLIKFSKG
jgi:hypothetical protein